VKQAKAHSRHSLKGAYMQRNLSCCLGMWQIW